MRKQTELLCRREVADVVVGVDSRDAPVELVSAQVGDVGELRRVGSVVGRYVLDRRREVGPARDLQLVLLDAELRAPREQRVIGCGVCLETARLADSARERR